MNLEAERKESSERGQGAVIKVNGTEYLYAGHFHFKESTERGFRSSLPATCLSTSFCFHQKHVATSKYSDCSYYMIYSLHDGLQ